MKKRLSTVFLCLLCASIWAQINPYEKDIKTVYDTIAAATHRGDWDKVLDHTYSKIFEIAPREQMRELIAKTFTDTSIMKVTIVEGKADSVSKDTFLMNDELFVLLYDSKQMQFVITQALSEPEKDHEMMFSMMKSIFIKQYGEENVRFDKEKAQFDIVKKKGVNLCSNTSPTRDKDSWTIMEMQFENPALIKQLLSDEVIEWVKKH